MTLSALILAATAPSIEGIFLQYGLIGAVALVLGLYARGAIKSTEERARRLEDDNRRLYQLMADQFIPPLTKSNDIIIRAIDIITDYQRREEKQAAMDEARRLVEDKKGAP